MSKNKYDANYTKALCTMISRGNIEDINRLKEFLVYVDLNAPVRASNTELDMLFSSSISDVNPEHYSLSRNNQYSPMDLILYSCLCGGAHHSLRFKLFKEIIKINKIDFSDLKKTLEFIVIKGDLELFNMIISLNPNFNLISHVLENGKKVSILDDCLSLAICKLTINKDIFKSYPIYILDYLLTILENSNSDSLVSTKIILNALIEVNNINIDNELDLVEKIKIVIGYFEN